MCGGGSFTALPPAFSGSFDRPTGTAIDIHNARINDAGLIGASIERIDFAAPPATAVTGDVLLFPPGGTVSVINQTTDPTLPGTGNLVRLGGINNRGEAVITPRDNAFETEMFPHYLRAPGGSYRAIDLSPLAGLGGSSAYDFNDAGDLLFQSTGPLDSPILRGDGSVDVILKPGSTYTDATGLNNTGHVVGVWADNNNKRFGFVMEPNGAFSTLSPFGFSAVGRDVNDHREVVGRYTDGSGVRHGFLATPVTGSSPFRPVMPFGSSGSGEFSFRLDIGTRQDDEGNLLGIDVPIFIDPVVAVGYQYNVSPGGPNFASILVDVLPGGDSLFELVFGGFVETLIAGVTFDFTDLLPGGVDTFVLRGIDPAEMLDPGANPTFVTGLTFVAGGTGVGVTMTAISEQVPVPATVLLLGAGLLALPGRRRTAGKA